MNETIALQFLKDHQPLPADSEMSDNLLSTLNDVRNYVTENPNPQFIPLILNMFGAGSGFGVYQLFEDALLLYPPSFVVPHIVLALQSPHYGVRYWSAQIASVFPSDKLIAPLQSLLNADAPDIRSASAIALGQIPTVEARECLVQSIQHEDDTHVREIILGLLA